MTEEEISRLAELIAQKAAESQSSISISVTAAACCVALAALVAIVLAIELLDRLPKKDGDK